MNPHSIEEIKVELSAAHTQFTAHLDGMDAATFEYSPNEVKWSAGQQLEHIHKGTGAVAKLMKMPKWFLKWKFGKANRPSRNYADLLKRYNERLAKVTGPAPKAFAPGKVMHPNRAALCAGTLNNIKSIKRSLNKYSEEQLDLTILPHPLLGKITVREMMLFTIFHVGFHHKSVELVLSKRDASLS